MTSAAEPRIHVHVHDQAAAEALRPGWQALCDRCPWATPFQRPDWLIPWMRHFGPDDPWILVFAVEAPDAPDRIVGLAPLVRHVSGGRSTIVFLGAGHSDYHDILIEPGWEHAVLRALFGHLAASRAAWHGCELDELRMASPLVSAPAPPGWRVQAWWQSVCPVLRLPARVDALATRVPRRHLQRFHQVRRRLARDGELILERATERTREHLLDGLFRLHAARWSLRGEPGVLMGARMRAFHGDAAADFAARDALALYGLYLGPRLIACLYGFFEARSLHYYLGGFDPALAHLSPGTALLGMVIEDAIGRGMEELDFLRGGEAYKYWWGAVDRRTVHMSYAAPAESRRYTSR